jgi:hypothetical protein
VVEFEDREPVGTGALGKAGVDGAPPGIVMLAEPKVGDADRQVFYRREDLAEVQEVGTSGTVPAGSLDDIIVFREWNPLETDVIEDKYLQR